MRLQGRHLIAKSRINKERRKPKKTSRPWFIRPPTPTWWLSVRSVDQVTPRDEAWIILLLRRILMRMRSNYSKQRSRVSNRGILCQISTKMDWKTNNSIQMMGASPRRPSQKFKRRAARKLWVARKKRMRESILVRPESVQGIFRTQPRMKASRPNSKLKWMRQRWRNTSRRRTCRRIRIQGLRRGSRRQQVILRRLVWRHRKVARIRISIWSRKQREAFRIRSLTFWLARPKSLGEDRTAVTLTSRIKAQLKVDLTDKWAMMITTRSLSLLNHKKYSKSTKIFVFRWVMNLPWNKNATSCWLRRKRKKNRKRHCKIREKRRRKKLRSSWKCRKKRRRLRRRRRRHRISNWNLRRMWREPMVMTFRGRIQYNLRKLRARGFNRRKGTFLRRMRRLRGVRGLVLWTPTISSHSWTH